MHNITSAPGKMTIRQQAEMEIKKELAEKAKTKIMAKLRERAAAEAVLKGIDLQLADLEQQLADGTI